MRWQQRMQAVLLPALPQHHAAGPARPGGSQAPCPCPTVPATQGAIKLCVNLLLCLFSLSLTNTHTPLRRNTTHLSGIILRLVLGLLLRLLTLQLCAAALGPPRGGARRPLPRAAAAGEWRGVVRHSRRVRVGQGAWSASVSQLISGTMLDGPGPVPSTVQQQPLQKPCRSCLLPSCARPSSRPALPCPPLGRRLCLLHRSLDRLL